MRELLLLFLSLPLFAFGQDSTQVALGDTTIYDFADEAPRFPTPCERYDTTAAAKSECAQAYLLDYIYKRALYPAEAREQGIDGTAVIAFIVERNGVINRPEILRDPGGDLGIAALRSVYGMQREVQWRPAIKEGKPVRFRYVLPVRFRLEEKKPYVVSGRDTIYTDVTKGAEFVGNDGDLVAYFDEEIVYPESGKDSCLTGQFDVQLLIQPSGQVKVQDIIDYNDLGVDFTGEAIDAATGSFGKWLPGEYEGRKVTTAYDISLTFAPTNAGCEQVIEDYNLALNLMQEGQLLTRDSSSLAAGLEKMDHAVELFPRDGRFRMIRGQTRMDNNRLVGACEDLTLAKQITLVDWYDSILPLICRFGEEEE